MKILILGITGAVGSSLAPELVAAGHNVRGLSRRPPEPVRRGPRAEIEYLRGDVISGAGLERALAGVDVVYYLVHSMEGAAGRAFPKLERQGADNYALAARTQGVRRTLYLGGPLPTDGTPSPHLSSRLAVESVLLGSTPEALAFRASIVIGAQSRSFRFLVRLIERLPILAMPGWRDHRTAPIDERDVTAFLLAGGVADDVGNRALDIAGEETLSYRALMERIRDLLVLDRPVLGLGALTLTPIAARVAALVAGEDPDFIRPLMESLDGDLLLDGGEAARLLSVRRHRLDAAIEHALAVWEQTERLAAR